MWKDILGFEGYYQISDEGIIKRLNHLHITITGQHRIKNEKIIIPSGLSNSGYKMVDLLDKNNKRHRVYVHRLIAQTFIPNPDNLPCVNHKDENKLNNTISNLEWCDWHYNNSYGSGRVRMVETRKRNGTYKNISQKTRDKISKALKGKPKSEEHIKHMREARLHSTKTHCRKDA